MWWPGSNDGAPQTRYGMICYLLFFDAISLGTPDLDSLFAQLIRDEELDQVLTLLETSVP